MASSIAMRFLEPLGCRKVWLPSFVSLTFAVFIWAAVGLGPYSGYNSPPELGDFEAQRHWMEITTNLSPREWYFYDFSWWRLDYPPLTAYHAWLCGLIGSKINSEWFGLYTSRGLETPDLKAYMRLTAIVSELVVFGVGAWLWIKTHIPITTVSNSVKYNDAPNQNLSHAWYLGFILLLPSLTIIDHGHFQYNSVMLGLAIGSLTALVKQKFVVSSILFVLALFFKQMSLYYAPTIFAAILGHCVGPAVKWEPQIRRLVSVGLAVLGTAALLLIPFYDAEQLLQIVRRIFPVFRGLWEDKVANLWCTINYTVFKLKSKFEPSQLQILALASTLAGILPSCIAAFVGKPKLWAWSFASCAWAFFLFSFQVHEKSVLLPLIPTVLTAVQHYKSANIMAMVQWICNISYFSMWPLLKREHLHLQYFVLIALFNWLFGSPTTLLPRNLLNKLVVICSYGIFIALAVTQFFNLVPFPITTRYPDLFVVGNMATSFACFIYFWLWQTWYMLTLTTLD